ncbi:LexA family protein (plasmid) [Legionella sp. D16C41]|uniref:LexA family protein n=1 Tax=Legionella sp. D16C41 TaxID=3402688 RepID=UPI003AF9A2C2
MLVIDPDSDPKEGDYVLCKLDKDDIPVFRKILFDGKTIYFKPINPAFGEISHHSKYKILGVVIKSIESYR